MSTCVCVCDVCVHILNVCGISWNNVGAYPTRDPMCGSPSDS